MDTRNNSYVLNNLTWGDQLLAGIGGSASRINMLEPLQTALPIIQDQPYSFQESTPEKNDPEDPGLTGFPISDSIRAILNLKDAYTGGGDLYEQVKTDAWGIFKTTSILLVCLILIIFGLAVLLYPSTKTVIQEAVRA